MKLVVTLCTIFVMFFSYQRALAANPQCLNLKLSNISVNSISGHFYLIEAGILSPNEDLNCVTVDYLLQEAFQPRIQLYSYLNGSVSACVTGRKIDGYFITEPRRGQYIREDTCTRSFRLLVTILYYDSRDLLVYGCMENNPVVQRFFFMSKKRTLTKAEKDKVYKASQPIPKEYKLVPGTYDRCNLQEL